MIRIRHLVPFLAAAALSACTLAPNYHRPASGIEKIDNQWPTGPAYAKTEKAKNGVLAADIGWRQFFKDPLLREAIKLALENNRDLRVAALKVKAAQAKYRIQRSDLFPTIDAQGSDSIQHLSGRAFGNAGQHISGGTFRTWSLGIGFSSYELDFFGRIRSLDKQALELYMSQIQARKTAQISLVTEVANDYIAYLAQLQLQKLAQKTYANQKHVFDLTKQSFDAGVATSLDLNQAKQALDSAKADIAKFKRNVAQAKNLLVPLLGTAPPSSLTGANINLADEHFMEILPPGLPSDLLTHRPDIIAAEDKLKAANANIGAARAAFFPSISLTGHFGTASSQLSGLFANNSEQWTFAPVISIPIFSAGANVANLKLSHVNKKIAIAQYQKAIQTAFKEVADALAARGTLDDQLAAQEQLVQAAHKSYQLSLQRFRQGVDNFLSTLTSQRDWYQARQQLVTTRVAQLESAINLYTALGGGWHADTVHPQQSRDKVMKVDLKMDPRIKH